MNPEDACRHIERIAGQLGEHFDAVQIMVSWVNPDGSTSSAKAGTGNWWARQGLAHSFINADVAEENACRIKAALDEGRE